MPDGRVVADRQQVVEDEGAEETVLVGGRHRENQNEAGEPGGAGAKLFETGGHGASGDESKDGLWGSVMEVPL